MKTLRIVPALAAGLLVLAAGGAGAQNMGFLRKGPVAYLDEADQALFKDTLRRALDEGADGETVAWTSEQSGASGSFELVDTHEDFGTVCRTVRQRTSAAGREGGGTLRLCRAGDGAWRLAPARRRD